MKRELIKRYSENPILTVDDVKPCMANFEVAGVFNAGATLVNGKVCLLLRVAERPKMKNGGADVIEIPYFNHDSNLVEIIYINKNRDGLDISDPRFIVDRDVMYLTTISHLRRAWSDDGVNFTVEDVPALFPSNEYESFGIEDPRITFIDQKYYINYTAVSKYGAGTALVISDDMMSFERKGFIFCPENKDVVIFPEKINGRYYALHRPSTCDFGKPSIWIASSDNMADWGGGRCVMSPRAHFWDSAKIGGGAIPIKTERGWLVIYHGADEKDVYSLGLVLLDLKNPSIVLSRTKKPILTPHEYYERKGFYGNVVFTDGAIVYHDGSINLYYASADEKICLAQTSVDELYSIF